MTKPHELANKLLHIVIQHTDSSVVWREKEITDEEMVEIGMDLENFAQGMLRNWRNKRREAARK